MDRLKAMFSRRARLFKAKNVQLAVILGTVFAVASWGGELPTAGEAMACAPGTYDVLSYGAVGNGTTLDTTHIQAAINAAEASGGGTVLLPSGHTFLSGSITLKSNITLQVAGTLLGSPNLSDYTQVTPAMTGVAYYWPKNPSEYALIYAHGATNITITGGGTIDGNALHTTIPITSTNETQRPFVIRMIRCTTVNVNAITLQHSVWWMQHYLECSGVTLDHVTVINHDFINEDGVDIDSCNGASIQNSTFTTYDDAVCLKACSLATCQNVTVNNCTISTTVDGTALKLGTDSEGGFKNVLFENCHIPNAISGIGILEVDGGHTSGITCQNITLGNVQYAIYVRLGDRNRTIPGLSTPVTGTMDSIVLDTITGTNTNMVPSWICGIPGHKITNVTVRNCNSLSFGGGDLNANDLNLSVPENSTNYPIFSMFGNLPAYGFYARHVSGLTFENTTIGYRSTDYRPPFVFDDVSGLDIVDAPNYVHAQADPHALAVVKWFGTNDATLHWSYDSALGKYKLWTTNGTTTGLSVKIIYVSTGKPYSLGTAELGALVYIDRSYTITSIGQTLGGKTLIRTANDDKWVTTPDHLTFTVNQPATVYVLYDKRIGTVPAWLSDGTWTAASWIFSDSSGTPRQIYQKSVPAGSVTLGGNLAAPAQYPAGGAGSYIVIVR
jgi:polygalacturonase